MATLLQVAQLGNPVLRETSSEIKDFQDSKLQDLIDSLLETVIDVNGVGIAAPQVYEPIRLFIVASHPNPRYPNAPEMEPTPMLNPKIISFSNVTEDGWEGCLSIPGIRGLVPRYKKIKVEYFDRSGKKHEKEFEDFVARIFQHELDHLDGIVFLDRIKDNRNIITDKEYLKLVQKK